MPVTGLHHVSSITGPPQATVDFYAGRLGMRLVKQTVNFDDPGTYHLYFADRDARPGSALTFFPWPDGRPGVPGAGQARSLAYGVQPGALSKWLDRFADQGFTGVLPPTSRFGQNVLTVRDEWGLLTDLIEEEGDHGAWSGGGVPEEMALGAFHSVTLDSHDPEATARVLTDGFGLEEHASEDGRTRFVAPDAEYARFVDLLDQPGEPGRMGTGTVHHIALRVPDDAAEMEVREQLLAMGLRPTPQIDRQYFHSVYTREPGGVLIELATDNPGFDVDEPADALGRSLKLPPQYEPDRDRIEARLPTLTLPY